MPPKTKNLIVINFFLVTSASYKHLTPSFGTFLQEKMGNLSYSHTSRLKDSPQGKPYMETCSFQASSLHRDESWDIHRGKLMPDCTDLLVKIPSTLDLRTECACAEEVTKHQLARNVLHHFRAGKNKIKVPGCYYAEVKKIGRGSERIFNKTDNRVRRSDFVVIQDVPAKAAVDQELLPADGTPQGDHPLLEAFAHASYHYSHGEYLLAGMKGAVTDKSRDYRSYTLTAFTYHSRTARFGPEDLGEEGIKCFFSHHQCTDLCRGLRPYTADHNPQLWASRYSSRDSRPTFVGRPPSYEEAMGRVEIFPVV